MAQLHETAEWVDDIYRIEPDDPVEGGEDGIDNRPHKQLANRTLFLRNGLNDANVSISELTKTVAILQDTIERLESLVGGAERLSGLSELENRVTSLELKNNKASKGRLIGYLSVKVVGENDIYEVSTIENDGGFVVHDTLIGSSHQLRISLPDDYDESLHRYNVYAYPFSYMYSVYKLSGTNSVSVIGEENKALTLNVSESSYTRGREQSLIDYISTNIIIEVVER